MSAKLIIDGLKTIDNEFQQLLPYKFNLEITSLLSNSDELSHQFFGKKMVFTGKMINPREEMKKQAKALGMQVLTSVTSKTDYLIIGANVGQKKIENANKFDIKILTESDYMALIANINQE